MVDQDPDYNYKSHGASHYKPLSLYTHTIFTRQHCFLSKSPGASVGEIVEPRLMRLSRGALLLKNPSTST